MIELVKIPIDYFQTRQILIDYLLDTGKNTVVTPSGIENELDDIFEEFETLKKMRLKYN
jgi:hypothetical protein